MDECETIERMCLDDSVEPYDPTLSQDGSTPRPTEYNRQVPLGRWSDREPCIGGWGLLERGACRTKSPRK
ncbi:MAG: hypothetical protein KKD18_03640 [Nanoarchaeota archaeon]|nr:hypothetical protein [Nanoarchaeota archaeon]MBU0977483.1 hypothetical protein [Nanoarchaeota archaeon]